MAAGSRQRGRAADIRPPVWLSERKRTDVFVQTHGRGREGGKRRTERVSGGRQTASERASERVEGRKAVAAAATELLRRQKKWSVSE